MLSLQLQQGTLLKISEGIEREPDSRGENFGSAYLKVISIAEKQIHIRGPSSQN